MLNIRTVVSRNLTSLNKIVVKNKTNYIGRARFAKDTSHSTVLVVPSTFACLPHPVTTVLYEQYGHSSTTAAILAEKYKSKKSFLAAKKPVIEDEEMLDMFGPTVSQTKKQFSDNFMRKPEMKGKRTQFSSGHTFYVNSFSPETSVIFRGHCLIPLLQHSLRYYSVNMKHRPNILYSSGTFIPAIFRQCSLFHTVLKSSSLLSYILDKHLFAYLPHSLLSSSSSMTTQPVIDKTDLTMNRAFYEAHSVTSGCLQIRDEEFELNHEQRIGTDYSESLEKIQVKSVHINKDLKECSKIVCRNSEINKMSYCEQFNPQSDSHIAYDDLYFKLMNEGSQAGINSNSGLSNEEIKTPHNNQTDKYNKTCYMTVATTDEEVGAVSKRQLTHTDRDGKAVMVDVGDKVTTLREARAEARIFLGPEAAKLVKENKMKKGDVLTVAQIAGITAAKQTAQLIPLCHNINLTKADVVCVLNEKTHSVDITSYVRTIGVTGVEMEALTAASIAALTVYDMCKAVTHDMIITDVRLSSKSGGKRDFQR